MRGFIASVLLVVAVLLVIWLIAPPTLPTWRPHLKRHEPRAVEPARSPLPEGRLQLVMVEDEAVVFLAADETDERGKGRTRFTSLIITPGAGLEAPVFTVIHETADCRRGVSIDASYSDYDGQGRPMTHSEADQERRPVSLERLVATDPARRDAVCGPPPERPRAEVTGWQTGLAVTPSLIAAGKAMAASPKPRTAPRTRSR